MGAGAQGSTLPTCQAQQAAYLELPGSMFHIPRERAISKIHTTPGWLASSNATTLQKPQDE